MEIRKMEHRDAEAVLEMMRGFYDSPAVLSTPGDDILKKNIAAALDDSPCLEGYILQDGEEIAGYSMVTPCFSTEYGGICIWVEDIYLKDGYRSQGYSRQLFAFLEEKYPYAVRFKLEVEEENARAIAAYKKNGYAICGYYQMSKER